MMNGLIFSSVRICVGFSLLILYSISSFAQISVVNPSFEDEPADATTPQAWHPCDEMTTPDILPGYWGVYNDPSHGNTYVGIITRENSTYESFGQKLSEPLKKGACYRSEIDLAHSKIYSGYNKPIRLRIYLGVTKCDRSQLIFESGVVSNVIWKTFKIEVKPKQDAQYLILEAYHQDGTFSHKGNILIDNLKPFFNCGNA